MRTFSKSDKLELPTHIQLPHPIPQDRINTKESNCGLLCIVCGQLAGDLYTEIKGHVYRSTNWTIRIAEQVICICCFRGKRRAIRRAFAEISTAERKREVLNALNPNPAMLDYLCQKHGWKHDDALLETLIDLRDAGEIESERDRHGDIMWRLADE